MGTEFANMSAMSAEEIFSGYARHIGIGGIAAAGVIGIIKCGEGPTVAMRFDIDALGVIEDQDDGHRPAAEGFASVNYGMMHACGHDAHATIGLGVAKTLMEIKDQLHGTIKLIFQPAEEGVRGAKSIVDNGHLDGVDFCIGSHVSDLRGDDAEVAVSPGSHGSLATTKYDVYFHGVSAHAGGAPHAGINALYAANCGLNAINAIRETFMDFDHIRVHPIMTFGGAMVNAIPEKAVLESYVRDRCRPVYGHRRYRPRYR